MHQIPQASEFIRYLCIMFRNASAVQKAELALNDHLMVQTVRH